MSDATTQTTEVVLGWRESLSSPVRFPPATQITCLNRLVVVATIRFPSPDVEVRFLAGLQRFSLQGLSERFGPMPCKHPGEGATPSSSTSKHLPPWPNGKALVF